MMSNTTKHDIAQSVRTAIAHFPPFQNMRLDVDEKGIVATNVGGHTWWRVPVIPTPMPRRISEMYEALAEIEGYLQDEQGLDILLFAGDPEQMEQETPILK